MNPLPRIPLGDLPAYKSGFLLIAGVTIPITLSINPHGFTEARLREDGRELGVWLEAESAALAKLPPEQVEAIIERLGKKKVVVL